MFESPFKMTPKTYGQEYEEYILAEHFHWTLEHIRLLPYRDKLVLLGILEGKGRARDLRTVLK